MRKLKQVLFLIIVMGVLITGCGAKSQSYDEALKEETPQQAPQLEGEVGFDGESPQRKTNQKLIYRASMNVEIVDKLEPIMGSIESFVAAHDGYIEHMEQYRRGYDPISQEQLEGAFMTIRIPHDHYNTALQTIADLGNLTNKSTSVEDVTLQYSDIESTLKMYRVEQGRLLEMLESDSSDIKDMIEIEKRLSEVRVILEKQESARRALDSQINYDTIELEITEVRRASDSNNAKTFGSRIKAAFMKSVDGVVIFFQNAILSMTYLLIPLTLLAVIVGILYVIVSKLIKRKKKED